MDIERNWELNKFDEIYRFNPKTSKILCYLYYFNSINKLTTFTNITFKDKPKTNEERNRELNKFDEAGNKLKIFYSNIKLRI